MEQHRIGRVCVNPPGNDRGQDRAGEWVEVIVGPSGDLGGHELQHRVFPSGRWEALHRFPEGFKLVPGTPVVVHAGHGRSGPNPHGVYHLFTRANWRLNNDGDIVRLLDPRASEFHRRELRGDECEGTPSGRGPESLSAVTPPRPFGS